MSKVLYLSQTFTDSVSNQYTQFGIDIPDVIAGYGRSSDLITSFRHFHIFFNTFDMLYLHQTFTTFVPSYNYSIRCKFVVSFGKQNCRDEK